LRPLLTNEERTQLEAAEGQGVVFVRTLLELTDEHAVALPGSAVRPVLPRDLPPALRQHVQKDRSEPEWRKVWAARGRNPEFALAVQDAARKHRITAPPLTGLPSRLAEFDGPTREVLVQQLWPQLSGQEKDRLRNLEGQWPDYPRELVELLHHRQLRIPGMTLPPGAPAFWDQLAVTLPEVPVPVLREFAGQQPPGEADSLPSSLWDISTRERLKEAYYRRNPARLQEQLRTEYERQLRKPSASPVPQLL
jgi:hypothetical protein